MFIRITWYRMAKRGKYSLIFISIGEYSVLDWSNLNQDNKSHTASVTKSVEESSR